MCFFLQRGTGLSTPLTTSSMLQFKSARDLADYLKRVRPDSIVNDAEFIRVRLVPGSGPWTVLGQVARQNEKYYKSYPQDIEVVREVVNYLAESEGGGMRLVPLPSGGILTPRGLSGLGSSSGFQRLHYLFERVWDPVIVPGAPKKFDN
ncbi:hypothetical protein SLA2020_085270 [Shorea laevis]